ncbi:MAG TPA: YsnF/AvaK domain-containing protein, partial [Mycobacteriales bacterium]|nr:YsnF/AvaK domain-containing protein [Mycobacteriales bacterium]
VAQVYLDDASGEPEWVTVKTGLFGTKESFVPLAASRLDGSDLVVQATKDQVSGAPRVEQDDHISEQEEAEIYRYYGLSGPNGGRDTAGTVGRTGGRGTAGTAGYDRSAGHDTSGPDTDEAMTRSEERLVAGTQQAEVGKARLRKHVVTETETVQVPVSHEEVRLEREPITDANRDAAYSGGDITEEEHEVTLRAEKPVVSTETEAVERVRLGKETVTDTETVSGEVRKEQIEFDDPSGTSRR